MKRTKIGNWSSPYFKRMFLIMSIVTYSILIFALFALQSEFFYAAKLHLSSINQKYMADAASNIYYKEMASKRNAIKAYTSHYGSILTASSEPSSISRLQALKAIDASLMPDNNLYAVYFYNGATGKISSFVNDLTYSSLGTFPDQALAQLLLTRQSVATPFPRSIQIATSKEVKVYTQIYWIPAGNNTQNAVVIDLIIPEVFSILGTSINKQTDSRVPENNSAVFSKSGTLIYQNITDSKLKMLDLDALFKTQIKNIGYSGQISFNKHDYQIDVYEDSASELIFISLNNIDNISQLFHFRIIVVIAIIVGAVLLGCILSFAFSKFLYLPIEKLRKQVAHLSSGNEVSVEPNKDEISYIAQSINSAATQLNQLFEYKESTISLARTAFLKEQLFSGKYSDADFWLKCKEHGLCEDEKNNYCVVYSKWSTLTPNPTTPSAFLDREYDIVNYAILNILYELTEPICTIQHVPLEKNAFIFICFFPDSLPEKLSSALESMQITFRQHFDVALSFFLSNTAFSASGLPNILSELQELSCYHYFHKIGCFLHLNDNDISTRSLEPCPLPNFEQIRTIVLNGKPEELDEVIDTYFQSLHAYSYESAASSVNLFASKLVGMIRRIENSSLVSLGMDYRGLYLKIIQAQRLYDAQRIVRDCLHSIQATIATGADRTMEQLAEHVIRYIEESYHDFNLSSKSLAQQHHVSAPYLNRIIRQKTGYSVSNYIKKIRLEKAVELLRNTNLYVEPIAQKVGFENTKYFYTLFKNEYGVSPNNFRISGSLSNHSDTSSSNE